MTVINYLLLITVSVVLSVILLESNGVIYYECTDKGVVKEITSIYYRTTYVTLEDGRTDVKINQPKRTIRPGSEICMKWERRVKGVD